MAERSEDQETPVRLPPGPYIHPKTFDLSLPTNRYVKYRGRIPTYKPPSLPEIVEGATTYFPRVYMDVEECLG